MKSVKIFFPIVVLIALSLLVTLPAVSAEVASKDDRGVVTYYPARFDRVGTISSIDNRGVIVDAKYVSFALQVQFMTPYNEHSSLKYFRLGQSVGYVLNKEEQIIKLCLILPAKKGNS